MILIAGMILVLIGIWTMLVRKHIIRMIIGFSIVDTGIHLIIVAIGYVKGGTAPILDGNFKQLVDPVPSALVLTAIVIGLAVTALLLSFAIRLYRANKSLNIDDYEELKW